MWRRHVDYIQDILNVSQELNTAPVSDQDNADSTSDAYMFDSATGTLPTVQTDTAHSDSNTVI